MLDSKKTPDQYEHVQLGLMGLAVMSGLKLFFDNDKEICILSCD